MYLCIFIALNVGFGCAIEPVTIAGTIAAVSALWGYVDKTPCRIMECCDHFSVSMDAKNVTGKQELDVYAVFSSMKFQ